MSLETEFQFLIGRLRTHLLLLLVLQRGPFQFLIGRLRTKVVCVINRVLPQFQFLIGRLRTFGTAPVGQEDVSVSIPHR